MSALTPDCDPDLSHCGKPPSGGGLRSTLVLVALVTVAVLAVTGDAVPGAVAFLAGGVGAVAALVLGARGVRLGQRAVAAVHLPGLVGAHRSRPAG
ncbi:hypothetical protein LY71_105107 [Geodermatophilus tzadiensis]|uniref:Uncharacterized protein n=1 Tax=Geodermatophilus tzadiensis TaxID=1137988 RepID=A0A2T0TVI1_9ACTN|nr:hypothetical protein [Geodermatophilus tzadiensis]PRY49663.1 hypothetical protein LY71_105107 [Geodermatophilus tzadiensis]